jgi:transcriptional regulator with XRE-family HTH domain
MRTAGDLGRRVSERRHELGLTMTEVAERAGMDPSYVGALEESPSPQLTTVALMRLAAALETTMDALSGGGALAPPGGTRPNGRPVLGRLDDEECQRLVAPGGVGRVIFDEERGPVALPVNYKMAGRDVVFRTTRSAPFAAAVAAGPISFEVDHIDDALTEGWSVLLSGRAHVVDDPGELATVERLGVTPWAGEDRNLYVRLTPTLVTGRRIRQR